MRKILFFSGSRAEYGLIRPILRKLSEFADVELALLVSGTHLSFRHGHTIEEIERDEICKIYEADIALDKREPGDIAGIMANALISYDKLIKTLKPDLAVVPGDRYEAFCMAVAAAMNSVPIAHLFGGCVTEGAIDDCLRHSITKMAHLHFTTCGEHSLRLRQLGESPEKIWTVGSIGVENIHSLPVYGRSRILDVLGLPDNAEYILATWHPETIGHSDSIKILKIILKILRELNIYYIFTGANADKGGAEINAFLMKEAKNDNKMRFFHSLGVEKYINSARYSRAIIGNSSSAVGEAPSLRVPVLDIGDRQKGRTCSKAVEHCAATEEDIRRGIDFVLSSKCLQRANESENPLDMPGTSENIAKIIRSYPLQNLLNKSFCDLGLIEGRLP